jgi:hypothetical protein
MVPELVVLLASCPTETAMDCANSPVNHFSWNAGGAQEEACSFRTVVQEISCGGQIELCQGQLETLQEMGCRELSGLQDGVVAGEAPGMGD